MLLIIKVLSGNVGIFAGHPDPLMVLQQFPGFPGTADAHAAFSKAQIQHLVDVAVLLQDRVPAHHADICGTVFHIGGHVRPLCQEKTELQFLIHKNQFSGVLIFHLLAGDSDLLKQLQGLSGQPPFPQSKCQISLVAHTILPHIYLKDIQPYLFADTPAVPAVSFKCPQCP